jgi:actin-related protein
MSLKNTLIINNGSDTIKYGFSSEKKPNFITVENKLIDDNPSIIDRGQIVNWDRIEELWRNCFHSKIKFIPSEHPVLLTEPVMNSNKSREKSAEIMFEKFNVHKFYISLEGILALTASGRKTGVVLDSGDGITQVIPIYNGNVISDGISRLELAGRDLNEYLKKQLAEKNISCCLKIAKEFKEKLCFTTIDFKNEFLNEKCFKLPDGYWVTIGTDGFKCPELLFKPSLGGIESCGIHESLINSLIKCHEIIRQELYSNIVLCGGTSMLEGFSRRIDNELYLKTNSRIDYKVFSFPERKILTWIGGSLLGSLSTFQEQFISKSNYEEYGSNIMMQRNSLASNFEAQKCFAS